MGYLINEIENEVKGKCGWPGTIEGEHERVPMQPALYYPPPRINHYTNILWLVNSLPAIPFQARSFESFTYKLSDISPELV
jgi:hypothetical protein